MRLFTVVCAMLLFSGLAFGQRPVVRAYPDYGYYGPYVPMVTTPQISLEQVSPKPVWYSGGGAPYVSSPEVSLSVRDVRGRGMALPGEMREREEPARAGAGRRAWTYFASAEETSSAAQAAQEAKTGKPATRTITNTDIDQENQKTGTVKYDGKTEKLE